ncbi:MAG: alpha/beta-hydrolase family protein [Gordonia sp. (in: high G+C Gram-positive bacteria)]
MTASDDKPAEQQNPATPPAPAEPGPDQSVVAQTDVPEPVAAEPTDADRPTAHNAWYSRAGHWFMHLLGHFSYTGAIVGTLFLWLSTTPSLLPRGPLFQGIVSGGAAAVGYGVGAFFAWLARYMVSRSEPWPRVRAAWWTGLGIVAAVGTAVMLYWYSNSQTDIRNMMGVENLSWTAYPIIVVVGVIVFAILVVIGKLWDAALRGLMRALNRRVPKRISAVTAAALMLILTVFVLNGVVADYGMRALNSSFATLNNESNPDSTPPTSNLRSGGPESEVSWESLGRMGRAFVSSGPTVEQLTAFNGTPAMQPIRVYAGLDSADSSQQAAQLAAQELIRTGALKRKVIGIAGSTGTGWVNRATVDSLEYMYNGDTAMVSMQYSTLPSWLSFLVDRERARQAGIALFEAVDRLVRQVPEADRPKVVVFGESLGSFAAEAPFGSIPTLAARTDGALFSGPTFSNQLWEDTTAHRDPGSPEWLPIYQNGEYVRFIAEPKDLDRPAGQTWDHGRIVYLQHPSDPIAWWSPSLILNKPDWLKEERGRDVLSSTRWIPFVTFLQVSADMAVAANVPDGHGHTYLAAIPAAWAQILQPPGWTPEKTERLTPLLTRD